MSVGEGLEEDVGVKVCVTFGLVDGDELELEGDGSVVTEEGVGVGDGEEVDVTL